MKVTPIQIQWEDFAAKVLPLDASGVQRTEMRRAFFAGAFSMLSTFGEEISALSDDEAMNALDQLWHECQEFYGRLRKGLE